MSFSAASNTGHSGSAQPLPDVDVLRIVGEILSVPPSPQWFQALVDRAVDAMGAAYAWVRLELPAEETQWFHSASCGPDAAQALMQADAALTSSVTADSPVVWLDRLPETPWFSDVKIQACLVGGLFSSDGRACGYIALVWERVPESLLPYQYAVQALASHARYAVLDDRSLRAQALRLRDAVEQYETLLQSAPVLFNAFEKDGRCVMWNEECERRFGWTRQEVFDHPEPLTLFYPDPEERKRVATTVGSAPSRAFMEWSPYTRSGERVHTLWSNVLMPNGRVVNVGVDITARKQAEAAMVRLSKIDGLTECWNRKEIVERLGQMLDVAREGGPGFVALMLDLDYFKDVNDRHGHLAGDYALQHFCKQLRSCLRGVDQPGRLGGEEFLVLLRSADVDTALTVFERLRKQLQASPVLLNGEPTVLTVSGGIAVPQPDVLGTSDMLRRADMALYEAKRQGRDRVVVHSASLAARYRGE